MTGDQLNQYIERIRMSLDLMEKNYPEITGILKGKRAHLSLLEYFTKEAREQYSSEELPGDQNSYAATSIENLVMNNAGHPKNHLNYAPMYMEIAKYNLSISRVCDVLDISPNIRTLLSKNKPVHVSVLKKIADFIDCGVDDLIETIDHDEHVRRLEKHAVFKTASKNDEYTDLVKILDEVSGKQQDTSEENPRQVRRDSNNPPGSGRIVKKIMDELVENMDEKTRTILRNNVAHNTDSTTFDFISSVLEYQSHKQLQIDDYTESED